MREITKRAVPTNRFERPIVRRHRFRSDRKGNCDFCASTNFAHLNNKVRPRSDRRGVELISDALPFGRLWYGEPDAISNAIGHAKFFDRAIIRELAFGEPLIAAGLEGDNPTRRHDLACSCSEQTASTLVALAINFIGSNALLL